MANKVQDTIKKIKQLFDAMPAPADPASAAPAGADSGNGATVAQYAVDGGQPVFVSIADDGMPDIDQNDAVFTDQACTAPYPDGTYKVTGTDFAFTVAGGIVTAVTDPDGKGAGTPVQAPAAPAAPAPAAPAAPAAPNFSTPALMKKELEAFNLKFEGGATPNIADIAVMVKALFENIFSYDLQRARQAEAIAAYEDAFAKQEVKLKAQEQIQRELFNLMEQLSGTPTGDPLEKPKLDIPKKGFETKAERMSGIVGAIKNLNAKTATK